MRIRFRALSVGDTFRMSDRTEGPIYRKADDQSYVNLAEEPATPAIFNLGHDFLVWKSEEVAYRSVYVYTQDPDVLDQVMAKLVEVCNHFAKEGVEVDLDSEWEYDEREDEDDEHKRRQ